MVEKNILIDYPWPYYFFFNKNDTALQKRFEAGIRKMIKDGSFDAIFKKYNGKAIAQANLKGHKIFRIKNKLLPKETPFDDPSLWFNRRGQSRLALQVEQARQHAAQRGPLRFPHGAVLGGEHGAAAGMQLEFDRQLGPVNLLAERRAPGFQRRDDVGAVALGELAQAANCAASASMWPRSSSSSTASLSLKFE